MQVQVNYFQVTAYDVFVNNPPTEIISQPKIALMKGNKYI